MLATGDVSGANTLTAGVQLVQDSGFNLLPGASWTFFGSIPVQSTHMMSFKIICLVPLAGANYISGVWCQGIHLVPIDPLVPGNISGANKMSCAKEHIWCQGTYLVPTNRLVPGNISGAKEHIWCL